MQSPEEALLLAMLRQALLEASGIGGVPGVEGSSRLRVQAEAELWILSRRSDPWSFVWVCDAIGVDAEYVRRSRGRVIACNHQVKRHVVGARRRRAA